VTHHIHINAVGIRPGMLEVLFQSLSERVRNLMEPNEFFDFLHLSVVACSARIQSLDNRAHVTEDACVHQCCAVIKYFTFSL